MARGIDGKEGDDDVVGGEVEEGGWGLEGELEEEEEEGYEGEEKGTTHNNSITKQTKTMQ